MIEDGAIFRSDPWHMPSSPSRGTRLGWRRITVRRAVNRDETFTSSGGTLTNIGTYPTGIQPVAIGIDPSTNHFLFTVNFLANGASGTISDFEINSADGVLVNAQRSPYTTSVLPTAVAAVPHKATQ